MGILKTSMTSVAIDPTTSLVELRTDKDGESSIVIGSGFIVGENRVATARHVVRNSKTKKRVNPDVIRIVRHEDGKGECIRCAIEVIEGRDERDDIAILVVDSPFEQKLIARVENVLKIRPNMVAFAGFPVGDPVEKATIGKGQAAPGTVPVKGAKYHWLPIETEDSRPGLSGGPVICLETGFTVGLITEHRVPDTDFDPKQKCWAINAGRLFDDPFLIPYQNSPQASGPEFGVFSQTLTFEELICPPTGSPGEFHSLEKFVGREDLLLTFGEFWSDATPPSNSVFYLYGLPWVGKSIAVAEFRRRLATGDYGDTAELVIEHNFDEEWAVEAFFDKLKGLSPQSLRNKSNRELVDNFRPLLRENRFLFVLDALEWHQEKELESLGALTDTDLRYFFDAFSEGGASKLLVTSRMKPTNLELPSSDNTIFELKGFSEETAKALYAKYTDDQPNEDWAALCNEFDYHPGGLATILGKINSSNELDLKWALNVAKKTSSEDPLENLSSLLENLYQDLSQDERTVMLALSQFSGDIEFSQLVEVIEREEFEISDELFTGISRNLTPQLIARLVELMVICQTESGSLHVHRFVKRFFDIKFKGLFEDKQKSIHKKIALSYRERFNPADNPSEIGEFLPGLETVIHLCKAREFGTAARFLDNNVQGPDKQYNLSNKLSAISAFWRVLVHFFPDEDISAPIMLPDGLEKNSVLHSIGYCQSVLGAKPKSALKILQDCARGMIDYEHDDKASEVFRSAAYSAISAGELSQAAKLLDDASEISDASSIVSLKLLLQKTVTEHMRTEGRWKSSYKKLKKNLLSDFEDDLEQVIPRGSLFAVFLARTGNLGDFDDVVERLKNHAQAQGWKEIVARMYSVGSVTSADDDFRTERASLALELAELLDRVDLAGEIFVRYARHLIGEGKAKEGKAHLEGIRGRLPTEDYPLLNMDFRITLKAAESALGEKVDWEAISGECRRLSYAWGLKDIAEYKKDMYARLV